MLTACPDLRHTYAALKPTLAPDTATTTTPDFLDSLWRAQLPTDPSTPKPYQEIRAELQRGIAALDTLLEGVEDPLGALRFVNNLVQAVTNVESLSDDAVLDAQFLRELVMFGFEYAKLNPTVLTTATENGTEAFLATLWQGESAQTESIAMRQAIGKLSELFAGFDTPEARLQWLRFATNLVQAVGQSLAPEENANPAVVSALIELGAMYAQLNPTAPSTEPPLNFFLDTLWQAQDEVGLQTGAEQLQAFIQDSADPTRLLKLATGLLRAMEALSLELPPDAQVLSALLELGKAYAVLDPIATTTEGDASLNFFLDTLWQNQEELVIAKATEELKEFLESGNTKEKRVKVIGFQKNLLKATKLITDFQSSVKDPLFISDMVTLGNLYTFLRFSEESQSPIYFLANVWKAQNQQELEDAAINFQNLISETIDDSVEISTVVAQNLFDQLRRRFGGNPEVYTGLWPWQERQDSFHEAQRQWALDIVRENAEYICEVANYYGITAHAIAGAILWEALENPYNLIGRGGTGLFRPGGPLTFGIPGKIHTAPAPDHPATDPEVENRVRQRRPDAFSASVPQDPSVEEFQRTNR
ncbi:hypothetical protein HJG54_17890 [Leptolyngbya sp. NK1-12]|uniref:Uncharacterized protein n=1 Tax=Leptolyngbya sp. NK1-12 TaxID=2547451 RepID=A0AA97AHH6_9CYAN|nr:hypothetical protein [Leptolyngbya sp. NK1-12]WNZ24539.1 hypothetical protein HJG54_17890 [Leptolyngbya sp. NK1-12]